MGIAERQRVIGPSFDLETFLVHRTVVATAENREVRQRRRAIWRPVADVMPLTGADPAAGEAAAAVPMLERPA
jgi:hypothetical protein